MAFHFSKITPNLDKMQYGPHNLPASPTALIWYGWKICCFVPNFQTVIHVVKSDPQVRMICCRHVEPLFTDNKTKKQFFWSANCQQN